MFHITLGLHVCEQTLSSGGGGDHGDVRPLFKTTSAENLVVFPDGLVATKLDIFKEMSGHCL